MIQISIINIKILLEIYHFFLQWSCKKIMFLSWYRYVEFTNCITPSLGLDGSPGNGVSFGLCNPLFIDSCFGGLLTFNSHYFLVRWILSFMDACTSGSPNRRFHVFRLSQSSWQTHAMLCDYGCWIFTGWYLLRFFPRTPWTRSSYAFASFSFSPWLGVLSYDHGWRSFSSCTHSQLSALPKIKLFALI